MLKIIFFLDVKTWSGDKRIALVTTNYPSDRYHPLRNALDWGQKFLLIRLGLFSKSDLKI